MAGNKYCKKHGGEDYADSWWLCRECSSEGITKCKCGGTARIFGEALMQVIDCEDCSEKVWGVALDKDIKELWNAGVRGEYIPMEKLTKKLYLANGHNQMLIDALSSLTLYADNGEANYTDKEMQRIKKALSATEYDILNYCKITPL